MNGLCDLENEVKYAQFNLCIRLALVLLCTTFHILFPQTMSGNHLTYVAILNNICDLENKVKVTGFKLVFALPWDVPLCTKFGETS